MGWLWVSQGALFEIFASVGAWGRERGRCTGSLSLPPYPPPAPCSPDKSERIKSPLFFIRNSSVCLLYCNPFSLSCDIWGTNYNYDNWEPEFMTIFVTWHLRVTLDSIRNSCDVLNECVTSKLTFSLFLFQWKLCSTSAISELKRCHNLQTKTARSSWQISHLPWPTL